MLDVDFLNLNTIDIVAQIHLYCRMELGSVLCIAGCLAVPLAPIDASSIPPCEHQNMSVSIAKCPTGDDMPTFYSEYCACCKLKRGLKTHLDSRTGTLEEYPASFLEGPKLRCK